MEKQNSDEKWKYLPSMKTPRSWFGATAIGEKIYIAGGLNGTRKFSSAEIFDSTSNKWFSLPDMKENRGFCAVVSVNGKVYAIGGNDGNRSLASGEMFDPAMKNWTAIPDMKSLVDLSDCMG